MKNLLRKATVLISVTTLFLSLSASAKGHSFTEEDYSKMVKEILVKNNIVNQESQVTQIKIHKTVASLAFYIAGITSDSEVERHVRGVEFNAQTIDGEVKRFTCNLLVEVRGESDFSGTHLEACAANYKFYPNLNE